ncbi:MAG TPA: hypothetical protein VFI28_05285 [Candidatus Limnocylindrales bacterium]|jgi:hypothetical protein|nr:hypothetical protein [Candidatus Limnocylindrales bacterium]
MTSEHEQDARNREGGERGEGRPLGVTDSARSGAEGRPSDVRDADAARKSNPADAPTEDAVDRGETPSTEHQPGGDL